MILKQVYRTYEGAVANSRMQMAIYDRKRMARNWRWAYGIVGNVSEGFRIEKVRVKT